MAKCVKCNGTKDVYTLLKCSHVCCSHCWKLSYNEHKDDFFHCFFEGCNSGLLDFEIRKILPYNDYKLFQQRLAENPKLARPDAGWICRGCTFINLPLIKFCNVCQSNQPDDYEAPSYYKPTKVEEKAGEQEIQAKNAKTKKGSKIDIGNPTDFKHVDHMGLHDHFFKNPEDENLGNYLKSNNMEKILDNDETKRKSYDFIDENRALEKFGNEMKKIQKRKAPPVPQNFLPPPPSQISPPLPPTAGQIEPPLPPIVSENDISNPITPVDHTGLPDDKNLRNYFKLNNMEKSLDDDETKREIYEQLGKEMKQYLMIKASPGPQEVPSPPPDRTVEHMAPLPIGWAAPPSPPLDSGPSKINVSTKL